MIPGLSSQLKRLRAERDPRQTRQMRQSRQFTPLLLMAGYSKSEGDRASKVGKDEAGPQKASKVRDAVFGEGFSRRIPLQHL